jgi:hypothetical protein
MGENRDQEGNRSRRIRFRPGGSPEGVKAFALLFGNIGPSIVVTTEHGWAPGIAADVSLSGEKPRHRERVQPLYRDWPADQGTKHRLSCRFTASAQGPWCRDDPRGDHRRGQVISARDALEPGSRDPAAPMLC